MDIPIASKVLGWQHCEHLRNLAEYCDNTSVHGLKYLTEKRRPWHERILWLLGIALSVGVCTILLYQTWAKWEKSNIILTMNDRQRAVWDIPFPAITICPETKIRKSAFDYFSTFCNLSNVTADTRRLFYDLSIQCKQMHLDNDKVKDSNIIDLIEEYSLQLNETLTIIDREERQFDFQPLLTEEGLWFSSNMLPRSEMFPSDTFHSARGYLEYAARGAEWSASEGYAAAAGPRAHPQRALGAGASAGLSLQLALRRGDVDILCSGLAEGFKVTLHSPDEVPRPAQRFFRVAAGAAAQVAVAPHETRADEALRARYAPLQRQCYFAGERRLRFFLQYTQNNCELECVANITLELCGCVAFHMPREVNTPVCGGGMYMCMNLAERVFRERESGLRQGPRDVAREPASVRAALQESGRPCGCLVACRRVVYSSQRSHSETHLETFAKSHHSDIDGRLADVREMAVLQLNHENILFSTISIYFEETYFIPTRRMELFGTIDFLANCGGLLGLCLGMSVLSIVELLYWLLLRSWDRIPKIPEGDKVHLNHHN